MRSTKLKNIYDNESSSEFDKEVLLVKQEEIEIDDTLNIPIVPDLIENLASTCDTSKATPPLEEKKSMKCFFLFRSKLAFHF